VARSVSPPFQLSFFANGFLKQLREKHIVFIEYLRVGFEVFNAAFHPVCYLVAIIVGHIGFSGDDLAFAFAE